MPSFRVEAVILRQGGVRGDQPVESLIEFVYCVGEGLMNDVPWKRNLQRAGEGFSGDGAADEPQQNARGGYVGADRMHPVTPREFENSLQSALTRASRTPPERNPAPQRPPRAAPHSPPPRHFDQRRPAPRTLPAVRRPPAPPPRKGGARNLFAIAFSVAIMGFAAHQVSLQWSDSRAGLARGANAGIHSGAAEEKDNSVFPTGFTFQPVGGKSAALTPSAAEKIPEAKASAPDAALHADIRQAEKVLQMARAEPDTHATVSTTTNTAASATFDVTAPAGANADRPALSPAEERAWMERAMSHLQNGDIASARLFLEHLAKRGSATAAATLARTYDKRYLASFNVKGLRPDQAEAQKWYRRAADLRSNESDFNLVGR